MPKQIWTVYKKKVCILHLHILFLFIYYYILNTKQVPSSEAEQITLPSLKKMILA